MVRMICVLVLMLFFMYPIGKGIGQISKDEEISYGPVGFESDFPQQIWDVKRQTGHFVGCEPVLFLDDLFILEKHNVERSLHPLIKEPRPMNIPTPFEGLRYMFVRSMVPAPDGESFYVYVSCHYASKKHKRKVLFLMYQTRDGVHLDPVMLDHLSPDQIHSILDEPVELAFNNILIFDPEHGLEFPPYFCTFFRTTGKSEYPYEAITINKNPRPRKARILHSKDGLKWELTPNRAEHVVTFESNVPTYDPFHQRYLLYLRLWDPPKKPVTGWRKVILSELIQEKGVVPRWTDEELVLEADEADGPVADIYHMRVIGYAGLYIGTPAVYHRAACPEPALQGTIHDQLAVSRDGKNWQRVCQGQQFVPLGGPGTWDSGMTSLSCNPVILHDSLIYYHWGTATNHDEPIPENDRRDCGIARLRLDGFVSLDVGPEGGTVLTVPFWPKGKYLYINADARGGEIRVEVLQDYTYVELKEFGKGELKGLFRMENCIPLRGDTISHRVEWINGENFVDSFPPDWNSPRPSEELKGRRYFTQRAIALKFYMKNAKLYSFWCADEQGPLEEGRLVPATY